MRRQAASALPALVMIAGIALADPAAPDDTTTGEALLRAGRAAEAAESFASRLAANPADVEAMAGRVRSLLFDDRWREALDEARQHVAAKPDEPVPRAALGEALFRAGRLEELDAELTDLAARPDAPARALVTLGRLRDAQGRYGEAVELMRRAVAADPEDRLVLFHATDATETRAEALELMERYLERSAGDDPDRIESAEGAVRLFRSLGERAIWLAEERPERVELPLRLLWNPGDSTILGYVIEASVGPKGKRVRLLLDSGSPGLFVVDRIARKRGFAPLSRQTSFGGGGSRRQATERGTFDTFALGELKFRDALATAGSGELDPTGRYQGLLGLSVFNGYRVTLDLQARRLLLEPIDAKPLEGATYWTVGGQWLVRAAAGSGEDGLFLLDTGATRTLLDRSFAESLEGARLHGDAGVRGVGGAFGDVRVLEGVTLGFGGQTVGPSNLRAVDFSLRSRVAGVEVSGFLGLDLLGGASRIVIDTRRRQVVLGRSVPERSK